MAIGRALARFGWEIHLAAGGDEALAQLHQAPEFAAVISDVTMPGMNGNDLVGTILATYPGVAVLFVTASQPDAGLLTHPLVHHLSKPVRTTEIRDHLSRLLTLTKGVEPARAPVLPGHGPTRSTCPRHGSTSGGH